jgi:hypothetical protein
MPIELGYDTIAILDMAENTSNIIETVKSSNEEIRFDVVASVSPEYISQTTITEYTVLDADATNLIAHYKFDDDTNKGLNSATSTNSIGDTTYNGTPTLNSSEYVIGKSSYFSGSGDHSFVLDDNSANLYNAIYQKPITIAFWCKSLSAGQTNQGRLFYGSATGSSNNYNAFQCLHRDGDNQLTFIATNNGDSITGNYMRTTQMPAFNTAWSHIAFVIEPQSTNWTTKEHTAKIYVNGVLDQTFTNIWYPLITQNYDFEIGRWTTNEDSREYDGYLDDFRIYNKVLTPTEIGYLANNMIKLEPQPIYEDTTHQLQNLAEQKTGVKGWRLVRFLPPDAGRWYSGNHFTSTNMDVSSSIGTAYDYSTEFMVPFGTYDEIMFSTKNMNYWLYTQKSDILGNYSDASIDVISSSVNGNSHTVPQQYNRSGNNEDPVITLTGYNANPRIFLYIEDSKSVEGADIDGGMCVFVRTSTDTETVNPEPEYKTLTFTYDDTDELVYDFTPYNDLASWEAYATSIGATTQLNNYNYGGLYQSGGPGYISITMPTDYDRVTVVFGNSYTNSDTVILYVDNVEKERCDAGETKTYTQTYTGTPVLKIQENPNTVIDDDLIITFSKTQTSYDLTFDNPTECDILIVGGGGGGGSPDGGGGGAGGLIYSTFIELNGTYTVKVGNGGVGGIYPNGNPGQKGSNSKITGGEINLIAIGGGGGGQGYPTDIEPSPAGGGSSGGLGSTDTNRDALNVHTPGQGNSGGLGDATRGGGGGGGAGASGNNGGSGTSNGLGGDGLQIDITGTNIFYAGGGGGGHAPSDTDKIGGQGGGGLGKGRGDGHDGEPNTGGGGGGGGAGGGNGGHGGSGIVIIRYKHQYIQPPFDAQWTYSAADTSVQHYGNVGIGTAASDTAQLTIRGDTNIIGNYYKNNRIICDNPWYEKDNKNIYTISNNVGIGVLDPQYKLHVSGTLYANNGGFSGNGSTSWSTPSDRRIKENVVEASNEVCFENVKNINLYKFNYAEKYSKTTKRTQFGFVAQEVQKYYPKAVQEKEIQVKDNLTINNLLTVDVTQLNYTLFGAIKHYVNEIDKIKSQLGIVDVVEEEPVAETTEEPVTETTEEPVTETTEKHVTETTEEVVTETTEEPVTNIYIV